MIESGILVMGGAQSCVVLTRDAILIVAYASPTAQGAAVMGGLLGGLAASAITKADDKKRVAAHANAENVAPLSELAEVTRTIVEKLPPELTSNRAWPKSATGGKPVTVFPKTAIQRVHSSIWRGITLEIRGQKRRSPLGLSFWVVGKARQYLKREGYRVAG